MGTNRKRRKMNNQEIELSMHLTYGYESQADFDLTDRTYGGIITVIRNISEICNLFRR